MVRESELINLRAEGHLCDLVVQVQDCDGVWYDFAAHKVVLAATSSFFFSLYECGQLFDILKMPSCVDVQAFTLLLDVLYGKPLTMDDVKTLTSDVSTLLNHLTSLASLLNLPQVVDDLRRWRDEEFISQSHPVVDVKRDVEVPYKYIICFNQKLMINLNLTFE